METFTWRRFPIRFPSNSTIGPIFPRFSQETRDSLELVATPLHIYCFETQSICWANARARHLWQAESIAELSERILTPYSHATQLRLEAYRAAFARGEDRIESWTIYPKGQALSSLCRLSGVRLEGDREAMLVEMLSRLPADFPEVELRAIEALRHTPLIISMFSEQGEVLMRNPAAAAFFQDFDLALPDGGDGFSTMFADPKVAEKLRTDANRDGVAMAMATLSQDQCPVHNVQLSRVNDPTTGQMALLVAQQDITQMVELRRLLAASEEALDSVLSLHAMPALIVSAATGEILKHTPATIGLYGQEVLANGSVAQFFADMRDYDNMRARLLTGYSGTLQMQMRNSEGRIFWVSISGARIVYDQQDALVLTATDIDQLYQTAADLETALEKEKRASEMQRMMLAIAAHEFRTPLAVIDSAARRIERHAADMTPDQLASRGLRIHQTVKRLLHLLENTVEQAQNSRGTMGYMPQMEDLSKIIYNVAHVYREANPDLVIDIRLPHLPMLNIDHSLMERVFVNLVSNAVKFSILPTQVDIHGVISSEDVRIYLRDRGIGIPEAERAKVFGEYVRGSNVGDVSGTGLGLSIVSHILELHGGAIEIVETEGNGTTFMITLPRS